MNKKIGLIFLLTFISSYLALQVFSKFLVARQKESDFKETKTIHETVKDRFQLFINTPLSIGLIGSGIFSKSNIKEYVYSWAAKELTVINTELLGLNILDAEGIIARVYPEEKNPATLGKKSQNFEKALNSFEKGEKYYLSEPFKLHQGIKGFALYVPITVDNKIKGWMVPVIDANAFFSNFRIGELDSRYGLIIKDKTTGHKYFETAVRPDDAENIYESEDNKLGRSIIYQSWRLEKPFTLFTPFGNFFISLFFASLGAFICRLYEQRKKAREQIEDIKGVLALTSKEALNNLVEIHTEVNQLGPVILNSPIRKNIDYITNLIEQIDLLQTMAQTNETSHDEEEDFLPLLERSIKIVQDTLDKRNIKINYDQTNLSNIHINANGWLIQNSVVSNVLSHALIHAKTGSAIEVASDSSADTHLITFHVQNTVQGDSTSSGLNFERRMEVARRILRIYQGELILQRDMNEGMIIRLSFPQY